MQKVNNKQSDVISLFIMYGIIYYCRTTWKCYHFQSCVHQDKDERFEGRNAESE